MFTDFFNFLIHNFFFLLFIPNFWVFEVPHCFQELKKKCLESIQLKLCKKKEKRKENDKKRIVMFVINKFMLYFMIFYGQSYNFTPLVAGTTCQEFFIYNKQYWPPCIYRVDGLNPYFFYFQV